MPDTGWVLARATTPSIADASVYTPETTSSWGKLAAGTAGTGTNDYNYISLAGPNVFTQYTDGKDYGFAIPAGATILGIEAQFSTLLTQAAFSIAVVQLFDGTTLSANRGTGVTIADNTTYNFGGPDDLWGLALTPALVNSAAFALRLKVKRPGSFSRTVQVNAFQLKVHYAAGNSHQVGYVAAEVVRTVEAAGGHRLGYVAAEVLRSVELRRRRRAVVMVCG